MSADVFLMVIAAAALHAAWNALVKGAADKGVSMTAVTLGQGLFGAAALTAAPAPAPGSWPLIALSVALHVGYQFFLMQSYRAGDLTQVYPLARGSAPLIVAAASAWAFGETLTTGETAGIVAIACGLISLSLVRRRDGMRNARAAALALATGGFIAAYSLTDGHGARLAGGALSYYGWTAALNAAAFCAIAGLRRPSLLTETPRAWRIVLFGGAASFAAYALVVHAFTLAPIALVTALRETSIVFALLIGVGALGERLDLAKVASTAMTLTGAALMRLSRH